ncbi:hypothetical protein HDE_12054 [Halotydeus destructor]|nr:hypothetical protein HDE_12054 [Halotydeus destructor]
MSSPDKGDDDQVDLAKNRMKSKSSETVKLQEENDSLKQQTNALRTEVQTLRATIDLLRVEKERYKHAAEFLDIQLYRNRQENQRLLQVIALEHDGELLTDPTVPVGFRLSQATGDSAYVNLLEPAISITSAQSWEANNQASHSDNAPASVNEDDLDDVEESSDIAEDLSVLHSMDQNSSELPPTSVAGPSGIKKRGRGRPRRSSSKMSTNGSVGTRRSLRSSQGGVPANGVTPNPGNSAKITKNQESQVMRGMKRHRPANYEHLIPPKISSTGIQTKRLLPGEITESNAGHIRASQVPHNLHFEYTPYPNLLYTIFHGQKFYKCTLCLRIINEKGGVSHAKKHMAAEGMNPFPCSFPECGEAFKTHKDLLAHKDAHIYGSDQANTSASSNYRLITSDQEY